MEFFMELLMVLLFLMDLIFWRVPLDWMFAFFCIILLLEPLRLLDEPFILILSLSSLYSESDWLKEELEFLCWDENPCMSSSASSLNLLEEFLLFLERRVVFLTDLYYKGIRSLMAMHVVRRRSFYSEVNHPSRDWRFPVAITRSGLIIHELIIYIII